MGRSKGWPSHVCTRSEKRRTLGLLALGVLGATLLGSVESEVFEEEDLSVLAVLDSLLDLVSDAVVEEGDGRAEELLELLGLQKGSEKE